MKENIYKYFTRRKKEREREQSKRLGETAFVIGAAIGIERGRDEVDMMLGGLSALLIAGIFEVACPKTANVIKSIL